jgi:ATP synthase protein I
MGVELVAAVVVGVGIGLLLDKALGTAPWMLVVFLFFGMGAGILNVYRAATGMGLAVGYLRRDGKAGKDDKDDKDDGADKDGADKDDKDGDNGKDDGKNRRNGETE